VLPKSLPIIEAATEPLADNAERRMAAHTLLSETFDPTHPAIAKTTARLEAAGRRRFPIWRNALPWALAMLVLAMTVFSHAPMIRIGATIFDYDLFEPWEKPPLPPGLTKEQRLLLGDPDEDGFDQKRRLHAHAPGNPAYFAEYAQGYLSENRKLPPDFLETAARIAPDNAFFFYIAAGQIGKESTTKKSRSGSSPPPRILEGVRLSPPFRETEFDITDPTAFEEALELVSKAAALPGFETYTNPMTTARVRLLPAGNMAEFTRALMYAYGTSASGIIQLRYIADLLCARAEQLSKNGDREGFLALAVQREAFLAHLGRNPDTYLVGELVYAVIASATAMNFHAAADRIGLTEMAATYRKQADAFQADKDMRDIRSKKEPEEFPVNKASSLAGLVMPMLGRQVNNPVPLNEADFEPLRMAEHELVAGLGILAAALLIPFAALIVFLFRFVFPPVIRLPAKRMAGVLGAVDWIWVMLLGIVLPILVFLVITCLTPLSGRGYGASFFLFAFPGVHLAALLLALFIAPAAAVRWRLSKQLAPFGVSDRFTIPLAAAALGVLLAWSLAAFPGLVRFEMRNFTPIALAAPPALTLGLLFAHSLRAILGKPTARIAQCATAVAVLPAYPLAIIALCAIIPIHSAGEKHWLAKETLVRIDPTVPGFGAYEYKVAAQKRKEINAILER